MTKFLSNSNAIALDKTTVNADMAVRISRSVKLLAASYPKPAMNYHICKIYKTSRCFSLAFLRIPSISLGCLETPACQ